MTDQTASSAGHRALRVAIATVLVGFLAAGLAWARSGHGHPLGQAAAHHATLDFAAVNAPLLAGQQDDNLLTNASFEDGQALSGWNMSGAAALSYNDAASAHDGQWVANGFATQTDGSFYQDAPFVASPGQGLMGTIWLRSSDGTPVSGALALFGLGGSDSNVTYYTVGGTWTQLQVPLDIHDTSVGAIRFQLYIYTTGHNLDFDSAQLVVNSLVNGSFEDGAPLFGWNIIQGAAESYNDPGNAHDGQRLANGFVTASGGSFYQDVPVQGAGPGQSAVGTVWLRSSDGTPYSGALALFGLGTSDNDVTYFKVGAAWTQIQVPLDIDSTSISTIRFQIYGYTVGHNLDFDGAQLETNLLYNASFEAGPALAGWTMTGGAAMSYNDPVTAHDGQWVANGFVTEIGGSMSQDVPVSGIPVGQSLVGSVWVRAASGTFSGSVALFGLGGSDSDVTYFNVGTTWTQIEVPLDIHSSSVSAIRFQIYGFTANVNLDVDGAQLR